MKKNLVLLAVVLLSAGLLTACGSSGGNSAAVGASTVETTGSPGAWTINMIGGKGATGGVGGFWEMYTNQVQGVKIMKAGTAATNFTVPNYNPPFDPGAIPCTVTGNITASATGVDPGPGVLYVVPSYGSLFKGTGSGSATDSGKVCTSLKVNAGVTLTLGLNTDSDGNGNNDETVLHFTNDVMIAGTAKTADIATGGGTSDTRHSAVGTNCDMGALYIEAPQVFVASTGSIITKGLNGTSLGQRGGDGGMINIYAYNYFINQGTIDNSGGNGFDQSGTSNTIGGFAGVFSGGGSKLQIYVKYGTGPSGTPGGGVFINTGKLTTNGGNGQVGGDTAEVDIEANSDAFNTGPISSNAGNGTAGNGGNGYKNFYIYSFYGSIYNSGALSQTGGNGTMGGGSGGYFDLYAGLAGYSGDLVNSGNITADAGSATVSGSGGSADDIYLTAYGAILTSGRLSANGGDSKGSSPAMTGGYLYIQNYVPINYSSGHEESMPVRPIQVSGNIYLNGGSSETGSGGFGGSFYIQQPASSSNAKSNTGIQLLGYASANLSGGDGTSSGGAAYDMEIYTYNDYANVGAYSPPGPIQNQIAITMKGGNGTGAASSGGLGGYVDWESGGSYYSGGGVSMLTNSGKIDVSGGNGGTAGGGHSNEIFWYGQDGINNTGALVLRGGNSVGGNGGDGAYNDLAIYASGNIFNSGAIDTTGGSGVNGGNGSYWSGGTPFGNWIKIQAGGKVTNTGSMTCIGGAGTTKNGNGGGIDILSEVGGTSNTGALNIAQGAGSGIAGTKGQAWIDWVQVK